MTRIPSTEKTEDFIYRFEIEKGTPLHDIKDQNLLVFEHGVDPANSFHSLDVTVLRDGKRAVDVELASFERFPQPEMTYVKFCFRDRAYPVIDHDYLLTVILRYLPGAPP